LETVQTTIPVQELDFKSLLVEGKDILPVLVKDYGAVYVTSLTRDGCSGCMEQKPLFRNIAEKIEKQHPGKTRFSNIHIQHIDEDNSQSPEAKRLFGHASYPTYMIHVKSRYGILEHYRAAYPKMEELEKQVVDAFELADFYKRDNDKQA
jgi:hypothetical protein